MQGEQEAVSCSIPFLQPRVYQTIHEKQFRETKAKVVFFFYDGRWTVVLSEAELFLTSFFLSLPLCMKMTPAPTSFASIHAAQVLG